MFSTVGRYHDKCGGYLEYRGGVQYHGDIMSTVGVILSTMGDTQYQEGYHEYHGGVQYHGGKIFYYSSSPTILNTLHGTHDIPHMNHDISPRYSNYKGWYSPWYS